MPSINMKPYTLPTSNNWNFSGFTACEYGTRGIQFMTYYSPDMMDFPTEVEVQYNFLTNMMNCPTKVEVP